MSIVSAPGIGFEGLVILFGMAVFVLFWKGGQVLFLWEHL